LTTSIKLSEKNADEMLLKIIEVEKERSLCPVELVLKGRYIQMGSGVVISDYREAQLAFRAALDIDESFAPALLELGWFYYAVEDSATTALPFFEKALAISLGQMKEATKGIRGCLEDLQSSRAATEDFLREIIRAALEEENLNRDLPEED
jgi:tetratricopeptide (TPR) repeat protein